MSLRRDRLLIRSLLPRVRASGCVEAVLLCTDGLSSCPKEALCLFREALRTGRAGRPPLLLPAGVMVPQTIKHYARRRVKKVARRVVRGTEKAVRARLVESQRRAEALVNTAYIERLQATFRARLAPLVRRTRARVRQRATLEAEMWLVGSCYNFCRAHRSLRRERGTDEPSGGRRWVESTPAQAAGLSDHRWSVEELLRFPVPPAEIDTQVAREATEVADGGVVRSLTTVQRDATQKTKATTIRR